MAMRGDSQSGGHRYRALIFALLVLVALGYGVLQWRSYGSASGTLTLHGNVDIRQVDLGFRVGGRIALMKAEEGDSVKAGDLLASLDKAPYQNELAAAEAQVTGAEADYLKFMRGNRPQEIAQARAARREQEAAYANARLLAERQRALLASGSISRQEYDNAVTAEQQAKSRLSAAEQMFRMQKEGFRGEEVASAGAALEAARARLAAAQTNLADTDILAPSDGIIMTRARELGAIAAPGAPVYTLALHRPVWVRAYVAEPDLGRLKPGMQASVITDSDPDRPLTGKVGFISPQAEFTPKNIETKELRTDLVYRLRILVDDASGTLRQGMPVTVTIQPGSGT